MSATEESGKTIEVAPRRNAIRAANDRVARRARSLRFASRVPMRCECDDPGCQGLVLVSLEDFHRLRGSGVAVIAGHHEPVRRSA